MKIAIIDIDSTLSLNDHRAVHLKKVCNDCNTTIDAHWVFCHACGSSKLHVPQSHWDQFLDPALMLLDPPIEFAREGIDNLRLHGHRIVFMTGRNEKFRNVTLAWLQTHMGFMIGDTLLMRGSDFSNTAASVYKEQTFLKHFDLKSNHFIFFDDDPHVLSMYAKYGLTLRCPEAWSLLHHKEPSQSEDRWRR